MREGGERERAGEGKRGGEGKRERERERNREEEEMNLAHSPIRKDPTFCPGS